MTRTEFGSAVMGLLVAIVVMFDRMGHTQAETNRGFDTVLETIMSFDRRVSRLEGRLDARGTEGPAP